jgi:hypothetical protein
MGRFVVGGLRLLAMQEVPDPDRSRTWHVVFQGKDA